MGLTPGAGGVGKTALAHRLCSNLLSRKILPFDAILWVSAKEEKLSDTGIEPLEPTLRSFEDVLDDILRTYGWDDAIIWDARPKEDRILQLRSLPLATQGSCCSSSTTWSGMKWTPI